MKINRLTEIILTLLNKRNTTAKELADKFQVSRRTIYRDIEILSSSGVPIYMNKGRGGGIFLLEDYSLNKTILSENDKEGLGLALTILSSMEYPQINSIIDKIGCIRNQEELTPWIDIDLSRWGSKFNEDDKFNKIKTAIFENKLIKFKYFNSFTKESTRTIEPMKLIYKGQTWYLYGYCRLREDTRIFRISRIKDLLVMEEEFQKREIDFKGINNMEGIANNVVKLKMKVKKEVLYRVYDDFDENSIIDNEDGTFEVNVEFPESEWLYGYILSFAPLIEVLEPVYIRDIVLQRMKEAINIYESFI